jgi:hypothetical protein
MEASTVARIEAWDRREVGDGRVGLSELGDTGFSGAVSAGGGWLLVLNGRIVGTSGVSVDHIDAGDSLTAYTSPHPSLPLLFAMQERGGERQGRYFTDETALGEVHDTLSAGSFTGYVELSEQVHSGDYHVVYYGGRALFVAFVGASERLVTGEEAFERARDEVGIYEVYSVDLAVRETPEPSAGERTGTTGDPTDDPVGGLPDPDPDTARDRIGETDESSGETTEAGGNTADDPVEGLRDPDPDAARARIEESESSGGETAEAGRTESGPGTPDEPEGRTDTGETGVEADRSGGQPAAGGTEAPTHRGGRWERPESTTGGMLRPDRDGVPWDDGRTVPALDPERTAVQTGGGHTETGAGRGSGPPPERRPSEPTSETEGAGTGSGRGAEHVGGDRVAELETEIEDLRDRVEALSRERDRLTEQRNQTTEGETDVDPTREFLTDQTETEKTLAPREALAEADVFVRYASGNRSTLADAREGDASIEAVKQNRRLETHTRFDTEAATVDGEPVESFLRDTLAYRFVAWLTAGCLFEIQEAGAEAELCDLYDTLPEVDRAEFDGSVGGSEQGSGKPGTVFDVVLRNTTGEPLFLADVDEGRGPTHGRLVSELLDRARSVAETRSSVAGVFVVTSSFFDTEVHEAVRGATKSGFLDRDSRASFAKTSRNDGYHVCLVEARDEGLHLSWPDL